MLSLTPRTSARRDSLTFALQGEAIVIQEWSLVIVEKFIATTLTQISARLDSKDYFAGNWSLRALIERLEQVGVV
jgi:hypothetical protein